MKPNPDLCVRPLTPEHVTDVLALERECFSDPWSGIPEGSHILALEAVTSEGEFAGYLIASVLFGEAELYRIAAVQGMRRSGIGTALLDALTGDSRAECVFLEVRASNAPAIALYEKAGFVMTGRRAGYYTLPAEDALLYRRERPAAE